MPQPLGYYGIKIGDGVEAAIDAFDLNSMCGLLGLVSEQIREELTYTPDYQGIHYILIEKCAELPPSQRLGLIKALCDRIELELMEQAK